MTRSDAPLTARDVWKSWNGVSALSGASLEIESGESVALVGESGSGKTTLLRCFNALVRPDRGEVRVRGTDLTRLDPVELRRSIGYVPQQGGLLPHWTVRRNVELVPELAGHPSPSDAATRALERVELDPAEFGHRWPRSLSGGQRQRVALARALANDPDIVLMDEPLGALDALTRADMRAEFRRLVRGSSVTVLIVTHDLVEAVELADRIAVMRAGKILQSDSVDRLRSHPADPYVARLLDRGLPAR